MPEDAPDARPVLAAAEVAWPVAVAGASVAGPSHLRLNLDCDDSFAVECDGELVAAVVCDGAGSARRGGPAARLVASTVARDLIRRLTEVAEPASDEEAEAVEAVVLAAICAARGVLEDAAQDEQAELSDYHTTVLGFVGSRASGVLFHIGDGAGVALGVPDQAPDAGPPGGHQVLALSPPENGEYANETVFLTSQRWQEHLRIEPVAGTHWVLLMTDGVTGFALHKNEREPDWTFVSPVLDFLARAPEAVASKALAKMLDRPDARAASGDDKTLVVLRWKSERDKAE